ncbi:tetratricopeptide repeat-containing glycosyltransferase family 2 protein [Dactylosporangium sp. CA-139066]|uniref:tetratricopeptide repeat-containing glycosyltransferase family 2 protein n=1 Tax=Dactylosporangium sp. CA-139066 TaxID=3239930 RepID=UPI003D92BF83
MSHIPVSVIVAAGGSPDDFHACLESLRPSLGLRDEVVCVMPADRPELRTELRGQTWLRVIDGTGAVPWADGLEATRNPVVVFVDGDVVLSAHWLDPILEAFTDASVVAAGPRCHHSYGPQQTDLPDDAIVSTAAFKAYARQWRQDHRGQFTDVDRLGPVCVAIRRDALTIAGGPTADLPYEELATQGRIVIAQSSLVAHVASPKCALRLPDPPDDAPLLSASLIVKDEEDLLERCLVALKPLADEIVVYDTGSTDRSMEIARAHGARVIEGFWNDHFGDARSRCLAHCTGRWALWVDADEVFAGDKHDVHTIREAMQYTERNSFFVTVDSHEGHEGRAGSSVIYYPRLFRRTRARIYGRLHEQVQDRVTGRPLSNEALPALVLDHYGYTPLRGTIKDKAARNLRLAELAESDLNGVTAIGNLARSQLSSRHYDEAIETARRGLAEATERMPKVLFLKVMTEAFMAQGRLADANEMIEQLRETAQSETTVHEHELKLRFVEGNYERTLELIDEIPESATNDLLYGIGKERFAGYRIECLSRLGRYQEAAQVVRDALTDGRVPISVVRMAQVLGAAGGSLVEVAELLPRSSVRGLLFNIAEAPPEAADELLEALWRRYPGEPTVLTLASRVGRFVPLIRAMEWSARLRQHGFGERCTLIALSEDPRRTPRERSLAAAIALEMFNDDKALPLLSAALADVPDEDSAAVLDEIRMLAPRVSASIELADA